METYDFDQQPVDFGVRIATLADEPLAPGITAEDVELEFWTDLVDVFIVPNTRFTLRYPTRVVGTGQVWGVLPFLPSALACQYGMA